MKILREMARGIEYEFSVNKYPPILPGIQLSDLIGRTMNSIKSLGFVTEVNWSVEDEVGNLTYERGLLDSWLFYQGPYEVALNGMRIYDDAEHLELSTPVFRNPIDAVIYDKVAERLAFLGIKYLRDKLGNIYCYKSNTSLLKGSLGYESVAWGTHGNYCLKRNVFNFDRWNSVEEMLIPFIISRIPVISGGGILPIRDTYIFDPPTSSRLRGDRLVYVVSPRSIFIKQPSSIDTTVERGFLNQRDEPHADPEKYWRLHDINFEAIRSDFQIFIRDALEVFVLKAAEEGLLTAPPSIKDPIESVRKVASETENVDQTLDLKNGGRARVLSDIFAYYIDAAERLIESSGDAEDHKVLKIIEFLTQKLIEGRFEDIGEGLDWIAKMQLIEEYGVKDEEAVTLCNQYSLLDESTGFYVGDKTEEADSLFDPASSASYLATVFSLDTSLKELVKKGLTNSPSDTREYLRTGILKKFSSEIIKMNWWKIYFKGGIIQLPEPLRYGKEEAEALLNSNTLKEISELMVR
ncbi:MAG: proteasome accessory factor PafA2 family protein [Candidatus Methanomethyliaceae archaeon]|nr:proteasome accessory factor PafA2 family protein [Candidatus Methanomethyliaceae archaeon]